MVNLELIIGVGVIGSIGIPNLCKYVDESLTIRNKQDRIKYIQDRLEVDKMSKEHIGYKILFGAGKKLAFWQYNR